jgi:3-hydroxyacyl-CoA dehydrogenase/enoyl-CoA hydratase/3-hydroxybutyryl-CoA epimerase
MTETIHYQQDAEGIVTLTIDVPDRSMNVLTPEFMAELDVAIDRFAADEAVRGVLITSAKDSFIAGADLKELVGVFDRGLDEKAIYEFAGQYSRLYRKLETCGKPVAAAINGTALGGGLELCLACHHRVILDHPKAVIGLPEVQVGLLPGAGGTQRLPRLIGIREALPLMLEGRHLKPAKAVELGIGDALAPNVGELTETARRWLLETGDPVQPWDKRGFKVPGGAGAMHPGTVQTFMAGNAMVAEKTQHNYPAPPAILSCVYEGTILPIDKGLKIELQYFTRLLAGPVSRNMIRTLFIDKGAADKLVRRPADVPPSKVEKLGVLGAGMMGAGIAYVSAVAGMEVVLLDTDLDNAGRGKDYSKGLLEKRVARGKMTEEAAAGVLSRIRPTTVFADLAGCDLVIEAVFEDRGIKADVTAKTEAVIGEDKIFASNTSTLPITGLAEASGRPDQFIGIHFFSPVDKMPLVEVIVGEKTGERAIAHALDYIRQIRKTPIVVNDSRGFYTSRVFSTYVREGMELLEEGVKPALIENAARMAGMPVGPLAVHDEVTIELSYKIMKQTAADLGDNFVATGADEVIRHFVEDLDRKGKRYGKGFYEYPKDGRKFLWPGLAGEYPPAKEQPSFDSIKERLLHIQALESARCLEENVITNAAEGDIGSIFGWGFPPWTGGTLSYIDTIGVAQFVADCERLAAAHGPRFTPSAWLRGRATLR